jgi:photosystem II stability/assembly factor-like uncharacterized protein
VGTPVADDANHLYAGFAQHGVAVSDDGGQTWTAGEGMEPETSVGALVVDPLRPGVAYAGARNGGVFYTKDGGVRWERINSGLINRAVTALSLAPKGSVLFAGTMGAGVFALDAR